MFHQSFYTATNNEQENGVQTIYRGHKVNKKPVKVKRVYITNFRRSEKEKNKASSSNNQSQAQLIAELKRSPDFEHYQRQLESLKERLHQWCQQHLNMDKNTLNANLDQLFKAMMNPGTVENQEGYKLAGHGKYCMERIVSYLETNQNQVSEFSKTEVRALFDQERLAHCVGGLLSQIQATSEHLTVNLLPQFRKNTIKGKAQEYLNGIQTKRALGMQIHHVNALVNYCSQAYQYTRNEEHYVHMIENNGDFLKKHGPAFKQKIDQFFNKPQSVVSALAEYIRVNNSINKADEINYLQSCLNLIGYDDGFDLSEVCNLANLESNEPVFNFNQLRITLTKRLINSNYLEKPKQVSIEAIGNCPIYIYDQKGSFNLSWREPIKSKPDYSKVSATLYEEDDSDDPDDPLYSRKLLEDILKECSDQQFEEIVVQFQKIEHINHDLINQPLLVAAVINGRPAHVIEALLGQFSSNVTVRHQALGEALVKACELGHLELFNYLLTRINDFSPQFDTDKLHRMMMDKAVRHGHYQLVEQLSQHQAVNINARDARSKVTLLMLAAHQGSKDIVKLLLDKGANINQTDIGGNTALDCAAIAGHVGVVEHLLDRQNTWENQHAFLENACWLAVERGNTAVLSTLVDKGANVHYTNDKDETMLMRAVCRGHANIVEILIDSMNEADKIQALNTTLGGETPIFKAAARGYSKVVEVLLRKAPINNRFVSLGREENLNRTALHTALDKGHLEIAKALIHRFPDAVQLKDWKGNTPLVLAASKGYEAVVKMLLELKNKPGFLETALAIKVANYFQQDAVRQDLLNDLVKPKSSDDLNKTTFYRNSTGLWELTSAADEEAVRALISHHKDLIDLNKTDRSGNTPFLMALKQGYCNIAQILMEAGADINQAGNRNYFEFNIFDGVREERKVTLNRENIIDCDGVTPLMVAAYRGYTEMVKALLENGADVNAACSTKHTALMCALGGGHDRAIVDYLLNWGANPNVATRGETPLIMAIKSKHLHDKDQRDYTRQLINQGADVNFVSHNEKVRPLCKAIFFGKRHLVKELLKTGKVNGINQQLRYKTNGGKVSATPLELAVSLGHVGHAGIADDLLNHGAKIQNPENKNALLYLAVSKNHIGLVKTLLKHSLRDNLPSYDSSCEAANQSGKQLMQKLLNSVAVIDDYGKAQALRFSELNQPHIKGQKQKAEMKLQIISAMRHAVLSDTQFELNLAQFHVFNNDKELSGIFNKLTETPSLIQPPQLPSNTKAVYCNHFMPNQNDNCEPLFKQNQNKAVNQSCFWNTERQQNSGHNKRKRETNDHESSFFQQDERGSLPKKKK